MNRIQGRSLFPMLALLFLNLATGCSTKTEKEAEEVVSPTPVVAKASPAQAPPPPIDYLSKANDTAQGAIALTQSAVSADDWNMVAVQWQRAIDILSAVPDSNPSKAMAKEKIVQYQRNLNSATQNSDKGKQ